MSVKTEQNVYLDAQANVDVMDIKAQSFRGKAYYVDGTTGADTNDGATWYTAFSTIQAGINAAGAQDTVFIRTLEPDTDASDPGQYAENLTIAYAKHGLRLIGVGSSNSKFPYAGPKIKNASAAALLTVNASGVRLENLQFNCTRSSGTYGILLQGEAGYAALAGSVGFSIVNCCIKNGGPTYGGVYIVGGYGGLISHCTFYGNDIGVQIQDNILPSSGHTIEYCNFKGINDAGPTTTIAAHIIVRAGGHHDISIDHCNFSKATAFITCGSGNTGLISNCTFADTSATLANSSGKVTVPAAQTVLVTGCWGGVSLAVIQSGV
jgi:hypothetical protein